MLCEIYILRNLYKCWESLELIPHHICSSPPQGFGYFLKPPYPFRKERSILWSKICDIQISQRMKSKVPSQLTRWHRHPLTSSALFQRDLLKMSSMLYKEPHDSEGHQIRGVAWQDCVYQSSYPSVRDGKSPSNSKLLVLSRWIPKDSMPTLASWVLSFLMNISWNFCWNLGLPFSPYKSILHILIEYLEKDVIIQWSKDWVTEFLEMSTFKTKFGDRVA